MPAIATLNDRRLAKAKELRDFHAEHKDAWSDEIEAKWVRLNGEYDELKAQQEAELKDCQRRQAQDERLADLERHERTPVGNRLIGRDGATMDPQNLQNWQRKQFLALAGWMKSAGRGGLAPAEEEIEAAKEIGQPLGAAEFTFKPLGLGEFRAMQAAGGYYGGRYQNALTTQTGSSGGFAVGESFLAQLERATLWYGSMLQSSEIIRTASGEPMYWPTANDTTNTGTILPENNAVTTADPSFGRIMWGSWKWSSKQILVPYELLRDSLFNLEPILVDMLGERIGRAQNTKFTVGVGGIEPKGIVTAATLGKTAASATAIVYSELLDLEHSVDISRRTMGAYTSVQQVVAAAKANPGAVAFGIGRAHV